MLPHEHLLVDFRPATTPGFAQADPAEFAALAEPLLADAAAAGVTAVWWSAHHPGWDGASTSSRT